MGKKDLTGGGYLVYKCRRCGKSDKSLHCPNVLSDVHAIVQIGETKYNGINGYPVGSHICKDGHLGVTDFIGGEFDKEEK